MSKDFPLLSYALEKYSEAMRTLAVGAGDIRSRLYHASFNLLLIGPDSVPDEDAVRDDIRWIHAQLLRLTPKAPSDPTFVRRLHRIHTTTAVPIAERVITVQAKLADIYQRRSRPVE